MELIKVQITNFRSVEDSEEFGIDDVTCLVGKNEAGKSAVLAALAALNPHPATPMLLDRERDYPRRYLTEYQKRHPDKQAVAVTTTWKLEKEEVAALEAELGEGIFNPQEVKVQRRYGAKEPEWEIRPDVNKGFEHLFGALKLDAEEREPLKSASDEKSLVEALSKLENASDKQKKLLERLNGYGTFAAKAQAILKAYLPAFMYFSNYDRMEGAISIDQLQQLRSNNQIHHLP
jgi:predicted ATP-dependent endonuclease of OLD family